MKRMTKKQTNFEKRLSKETKKQIYELIDTKLINVVTCETDIQELNAFLKHAVHESVNRKINAQNFRMLKNL